MKTTHLIHERAGSPAMQCDVSGICRTCGNNSAGLPFNAWVRDTFIDYDKLLPGNIICQACQFCFCESSELLAHITGKERPQRMRNYSHFVVGGQWIPLSKSDKREMSELLAQSPAAAIIATSGQKHIIFRSRPGWWQIEEISARPFPDLLFFILPFVTELYDGGFSKGEIESGRYLQYRIISFGLSRWREIESTIKPLRGSMALQLAVFLAQKKEGDTE